VTILNLYLPTNAAENISEFTGRNTSFQRHCGEGRNPELFKTGVGSLRFFIPIETWIPAKNLPE
jgi:hypothetical protein